MYPQVGISVEYVRQTIESGQTNPELYQEAKDYVDYMINDFHSMNLDQFINKYHDADPLDCLNGKQL